MARLKSSLSMRINRFGVRMVRSALLRFARRAPRPADLERADKRVVIVLWTAFGMGGTIRAAINLAEYLAQRDYDVEIISGVRERERAFFGDFPAGLKVSALHDRRPEAKRRGLRGLRPAGAAARAERAHALLRPLVPRLEPLDRHPTRAQAPAAERAC